MSSIFLLLPYYKSTRLPHFIWGYCGNSPSLPPSLRFISPYAILFLFQKFPLYKAQISRRIVYFRTALILLLENRLQIP